MRTLTVLNSTLTELTLFCVGLVRFPIIQFTAIINLPNIVIVNKNTVIKNIYNIIYTVKRKNYSDNMGI